MGRDGALLHPVEEHGDGIASSHHETPEMVLGISGRHARVERRFGAAGPANGGEAPPGRMGKIEAVGGIGWPDPIREPDISGARPGPSQGPSGPWCGIAGSAGRRWRGAYGAPRS